MPNNFSYNINIPSASNSPSVDQPNMQTNTNSISSLISIDHVGFNTNGSGIHKQVTLTNEAAPGLGDGNGVLYANLLNGNSWPVWQNALGSFALMSQASTAVANGFVSLPAGLLLQWGSFNPNISTSVSFPTTFPTNVFSVQLTGSASNNSTFRAAISTGTLTTSGFTFQGSVDSHWTPIYFLAIGN